MSEPDPFVVEMNAALDGLLPLLSIARDSALQNEALAGLDALHDRLEAETQSAIARHDEFRANQMLGFKCVLSALGLEIQMWLLLKAEDPEAAWDCLVDAQTSALSATRAHPGFAHVEHHFNRLEAIEQLVFPPQVFMSSGLIVGRQACSICQADYESCDHVAGRPYWGRFCRIQGHDLQLDHAAIVEHPADKRCRVVTVPVEGGHRNKMTWKFEAGEGRTMSTKLLCAG
uniref:Uncharacterized protein n=1 Tax=Caulobacter sp. (strain K31) TaxID=366602 RepID=B0T6I3_CAUSK